MESFNHFHGANLKGFKSTTFLAHLRKPRVLSPLRTFRTCVWNELELLACKDAMKHISLRDITQNSEITQTIRNYGTTFKDRHMAVTTVVHKHYFFAFRLRYCIVHDNETKWASAWDFQQCGILTCVDSDEPVQSPFKLRNSKWCSVSSLTIIEYSSD